MKRVSELLGKEVPMHWVRDQMIKFTGSAKRTPDTKGRD